MSIPSSGGRSEEDALASALDAKCRTPGVIVTINIFGAAAALGWGGK